jgi:hypothetical protein
MTTGTAKNVQHRIDEVTTAWLRTGRGEYRNEAGWVIRKAAGGWTITRPNGFRADRFVWPSLFEAKHQVDTRLALQPVA